MVQIIVNGIFESSVILLVALGFTLIYGTAKFFHLAHGATFMIGGYTTYLSYSLTQNLFVSIFLAIIVSACIGIGMEVFVYKYPRKYNAPGLVYLIVSLGLLLLFQSIVSLLFGNEIRTISLSESIAESFEMYGAIVTGEQLITICTTLVLSVLLFVLMNTGIGLSLKALSESSFLAKAMGINVDLMMIITFAIGSGLAGIAGGLVGIEMTIYPAMGFSGILYAMLACIVGGVGNITGTIIGSIIIGMVQSVSVFFLPPEWKDTIALGVLLLVLLIRPHGLIPAQSR
jgi:branched-chain amino acid transport system permease protein